MSLSIFFRPRTLAWSLNPIANIFAYIFPTTGDRVNVQLQKASTLATLTEVSYPVDTSVISGTMRIDLSHLMHPFTSYTRPTKLTPGAISQTIEECIGNIASFKIRYRGAPPGYPISWVQDSATQYVIRGGIGDMTFSVEEDLNFSTGAMVLPRNSNFLTWAPSGRFQTPDEWGWLLYLSQISNDQRVSYYVSYVDGTSSVFTRLPVTGGVSNMQYRNWYIPTGVDQCGLDPAGKGVRLVNIQVEKYDAGTFTWSYVDNYVINVDNRHFYNSFTLYYRNSVGGWDQISNRGEHERSSNAERKESDAPSPFSNGRNPYYDATIRPTWRLNTGYISKAHLAALDDLLLSKECALGYAGQWLPVRVTSKSLSPISTKDNLANTLIEIEASGSFTSYPTQLTSLL